MTDSMIEDYIQLRIENAMTLSSNEYIEMINRINDELVQLKKGFDTYSFRDWEGRIAVSTSCGDIKNILNRDNQNKMHSINRFENDTLRGRLKKAFKGQL